MALSSRFLISLIDEYTTPALTDLTASGTWPILAGATPAAMAMSVRVHCWPPKQRASVVNRKATLSGPTETPCCNYSETIS